MSATRERPDAATEASAAGTADAFRQAMRNLAGGVSVVTVGRGDRRTGITVTSATSLSMQPPSLLFCINRSSSALPTLLDERVFGLNVLGAGHTDLADRFAGRGGVAGGDRYVGVEWVKAATGVALLADALAAVDCTVDTIVEWHTHFIVIGQVQAVRIASGATPLMYWQGRYERRIGLREEAGKEGCAAYADVRAARGRP